MNAPSTPLTRRAVEQPITPSRTGVRVSPAASDTGKLASVIQENRVKIGKGWEELNRLDQLLDKMDRLLQLRKLPEAPKACETPAAPEPAPAALVTRAA